VTDAELDRIVAALKAGKRFRIYGADGEWGFDPLPDGTFRLWQHDPGQDIPDEIVDEARVRRDLKIFDHDQIARRLS
jgi:hypothetical protein